MARRSGAMNASAAGDSRGHYVRTALCQITMPVTTLVCRVLTLNTETVFISCILCYVF